MKQVKKPVFFIVFILIAVFTYFAIAGFSTFYGDIENVHIRGVKDIRWGIDIRGGVDVTFTPSEDALIVYSPGSVSIGTGMSAIFSPCLMSLVQERCGVTQTRTVFSVFFVSAKPSPPCAVYFIISQNKPSKVYYL